MTETLIPKLVIGFEIPTTISMLVTNIYNMADTYFIGGIGQGFQPVSAFNYGAKKYERVRKCALLFTDNCYFNDAV